MKDMARPIHVDEDRLRLSLKEVLGMAVGTVIAVVVVWGFLLGLLALGSV